MNKIFILFSIIFFSVQAVCATVVRDNFVEEWFCGKEIDVVEANRDYDYQGLSRAKIILSPTEKVSTPNNVYDGQKINLIVKRNARLGTILLTKGTKASAIVELYTTNGMTGIPATITLGRFNIDGVDSSHLRYYYVKKGQDRTLWILPLKWALTFIPFVGTFTNLIKGGQANLSPADDIVIYYYD